MRYLRIGFGVFMLTIAALAQTAAADCVYNPFDAPGISGVVSGLPVTVVFGYSGGNGEIFDVTAYWLGAGGNGPALLSKKISALRGGDRMDAFFEKSRLYVSNAVYGPNEAHCCYTHRAVRAFAFDSAAARTPALRLLGTAIVKNPDFPSIPDMANCPPGQAARRLVNFLTAPYERALMTALKI